MADPDIDDIERRMNGALEMLKKEFGGLRTGRASASLLEPIVVEAYGSPTPLNQVANINVPEPRMLTVQVWDKTMVQSVEKAIRNCGIRHWRAHGQWLAGPPAASGCGRSCCPVVPGPSEPAW